MKRFHEVEICISCIACKCKRLWRYARKFCKLELKVKVGPLFTVIQGRQAGEQAACQLLLAVVH